MTSSSPDETRSVLIVDAMNVLYAAVAAGVGSVGDPKRWLIDACASWAALTGAAVLMVFDGSGPVGVSATVVGPGRCAVVHAGDVTADTVIEREAASCARAGIAFRIASSDRQVAAVTAAAAAGPAIDAPGFLALLYDCQVDGDDPLNTADGAPRTTLGDRLPDDVARRLDRLRHDDRA